MACEMLVGGVEGQPGAFMYLNSTTSVCVLLSTYISDAHRSMLLKNG